MTALVLMIIALQTASIPPPLPQDPGPERRAAAAALFDADPYTSENSWGIRIAASRLAADVLTERNANLYDRDSRLADRMGARAKTGQEQIIAAAIKCVAEPIAWRLYVPDLDALKTFSTSTEGKPFWSYFVASQPWYDCFRQPVREYLAPYIDEDLQTVITETPLR